MNEQATYDQTIKTNSLIRHIVEHTNHEYGKEFFRLLVKHLADALQVSGAWVTEYYKDEKKLNSLAFWYKDHYVDQYEYDIVGTPCELVVNSKDYILISDKLIELFPADPDLRPFEAVSYMGLPLLDKNKEVIGHLSILDTNPLQPNKEQEALFNLFVQRANAEFLRLKTEDQLIHRELKLSKLVDGVHDAILEIDAYGFITLINPAANRLFGITDEELVGTLVFGLFDEESGAYLRQTLKEIREGYKGDNLIKHNLQCASLSGEVIPTEASLCFYEVKNNLYISLLLRDLKDLRRAEQRIEIMEGKNSLNDKGILSGIVGESKPVVKVMDEIAQIAVSNSTVLLLGESGTGKEVFARYLHERSIRKDKPLIKVNCAAIPTNLIESEFFGHEKGAFTGAVSRREGRFSLADGGTLFLDEIGELPLEMQPKLLRVLQEGEFETVGGQRTLKVNVRIIAATNRNLQDMVKEGTFREDLFYRLNVIPVSLPPLRERGNDIILLAEMFIKKFSRQIGKKILPLSSPGFNLLLQYPWPGNIRELEHVIERAVILSKDGNLDLSRFLPAVFPEKQSADLIYAPSEGKEGKVLTIAELEELERKNIQQALNMTSWKISGKAGAASMLGIPPSTLNSKIKALGIER